MRKPKTLVQSFRITDEQREDAARKAERREISPAELYRRAVVKYLRELNRRESA